MMQEVEVLKTIPELVCSYFSEEQFTLSYVYLHFTLLRFIINSNNQPISEVIIGKIAMIRL